MPLFGTSIHRTVPHIAIRPWDYEELTMLQFLLVGPMPFSLFYVDTTLDMLSAGDDHFMPTVILDGHFGAVNNSLCKGKWSCHVCGHAITVISAQWSCHVHTHKHLLAQSVHTAAEYWEPATAHKIKSYADDAVLKCSKSRLWFLHNRDWHLKHARKLFMGRFVCAWYHKAEVLLSENLILPENECSWSGLYRFNVPTLMLLSSHIYSPRHRRLLVVGVMFGLLFRASAEVPMPRMRLQKLHLRSLTSLVLASRQLRGLN